MSFLQFVSAHGAQFLSLLFGLLLLISEYMSMNPKIESNGIFQFVRNWLKSKAGQ
jgi:hypothetical protein